MGKGRGEGQAGKTGAGSEEVRTGDRRLLVPPLTLLLLKPIQGTLKLQRVPSAVPSP